MNTVEKRAAFRRLHESGWFVMPNPWDAGSARLLQGLGFKALASTSAGMAWAKGLPDGRVDLDDVLRHLSMLAASVDVPLNADFENGHADAAEAVAKNVARAVETGIAGLSIEDSTGNGASPLYDFEDAVARIAAARRAIDASGTGVVLTARSEGFIRGRPDLEETIRRLTAFSQAGADCLYAPGIQAPEQIAAVVKAVAPKPINVLTLGHSAATLAGLGVRRISVGGSLARVAWTAFLGAAREIAEHGTFESFSNAAPGSELNRAFAQQSK
ncbi:MAG TPA: isocitrate lyase/phosphoenolpyruvate mutase family protein [Alphaproteobacteria bacterium]|nr:isocitrate lyase/phosphoenolpyruvate mutase family protein [Alphaproteobacteria bacterium]